MYPGLGSVVNKTNNAEWNKSKETRVIHDGSAWLGLEMRQKSDGKMHKPSDIDIDSLIGFAEVEIINVEWTLDARIVDQAVLELLYECRNGSNVAGIKDIVGSIVT